MNMCDDNNNQEYKRVELIPNICYMNKPEELREVTNIVYKNIEILNGVYDELFVKDKPHTIQVCDEILNSFDDIRVEFREKDYMKPLVVLFPRKTLERILSIALHEQIETVDEASKKLAQIYENKCL